MSENPFLWDVTASNNDDADAAIPWPEGMAPSAVNNSARGIMAGFARYIADTNGSITSGGSANAYTVTSNSGHTTLTNGIRIDFKASFSNTGASTLNLNAIGAKKIRTFGLLGETALTAGQIQSGGTYQFRYDAALDSSSGGFLLLNPTVDASSLNTPGTMKLWAGPTLETGWLWCDHGEYFRTGATAALWAAIGDGFGQGNGTTTFNVPDLRGRVPFGKDNMGGSAAGRLTLAGSGGDPSTLATPIGFETITLSSSQLPSITPSGSIDPVTPTGTNTAPGITFSSSGTSTYRPAGTNTASSITSGTTANIPVFNTGAGGGSNRFLSDTVTGLNATFGVTGTAAAQTFTGTDVTASASAPTFTGTPTTPTFNGTPFGGDQSHSNVPPGLICNVVIKY